MSDDLPPDGDPFGGIPFIGELMRMLQGQAGGGTDAARQLARTIANDGESEANIDPADRIALEELVRVAELRVQDATDLPVARHGALRVTVANRSQWADQTIDDYRPLFETLAAAMTATMALPDDVPESDPMAQMMAGFSQMMGPMMLGMTTGSMVGNLARSALGGYSLPVPRPPDAPLLVLLRNVDHFGAEWSLDRDDLRLWVCLHEVAHHAVLNVPHVRERLTDLLHRHAGGFEQDPAGIGAGLDELDLSAGPDALAELQETLSDPDKILGAVRSPAQEALQPELTALVAAVTGYVDHVMDQTGGTLIGSYAMLTEALRRRRVEADASDRFVERILGLELDRAQYERGTAFVAGIVERAGSDGLNRLFAEPGNLPTPNEVDAPGLWLARIDLPDDDEPDAAQ
ncbi:MAG: zinc-dependent metalloprotease [Acidimicrobiales bacterium]|nr:zinc-dependent metalloprotease [Acidimicrobiales bacterium]